MLLVIWSAFAKEETGIVLFLLYLVLSEAEAHSTQAGSSSLCSPGGADLPASATQVLGSQVVSLCPVLCCAGTQPRASYKDEHTLYQLSHNSSPQGIVDENVLERLVVG